MITKSQFFAMLNDKENRVGVTAHIATFEEANGSISLIVKQNGAPNFGLSTHRATTTTAAAFTKYNTWLNEWFTAQAEAAQARIDLLAQTEAAHAEALAINEALDAGLTEEWALKVGAKEISLADALGDMDTDTECAAMEVSPAMQRYTVWLDKAKQNDDRLVAWNCPACNMQLHGLYPDTDREEWDSATLCPACDHLYFKITRLGKDGKGEVELRTL